MSDHADRPQSARKPLPPRPDKTDIETAQLLLTPWRWLTEPKFYGLDLIPRDRPVLFVGNHTVGGVLDIPLMHLGIYDHCGIIVRSLGDHIHFGVPGWTDILERFGTVEGTPENCAELMRAGEYVLVFPGGGREVCKRKGEKYRLIWKQRLGFARLAIEHGYPIVPFAAVGADDCYDILLDGNDLMASPLGPLIETLNPRPDLIPPLVRGVGPTALPRPERFYFQFGEPIESTPFANRTDDNAACAELRDEVRAAIERGIGFLLGIREHDPKRNLTSRLWRKLTGGIF